MEFIAQTYGLKQRGTDKIVACELTYNALFLEFENIGKTLKTGIYDVVLFCHTKKTTVEKSTNKYFTVI